MTDPSLATSVEPGVGVASGGPAAGKPSSLWGDARKRLMRSPVFIGSVLYLLVVTSMALFPRLWTSQTPDTCNIRNSRNSPELWDHPFGFNLLGCDYYAHAIYGARPSLAIAVLATASVVVIGGLLGLLSGFFGGWLDAILSRITDIFLSLPFLLGALVLLAIVSKRNILTISLALIVLGWTVIARIMRGSVLEAKNLDYVHAARALGASNGRIMLKHILPNAVAPVVVYATILLGGFVAAEATLTFLGVGLQPPAASWGVMIAMHQIYFAQQPWLLLFPVGLLVGTVLSFILAGDVLRDALDPKLQ
ncbi:ABC transporter permease [Nocardioides donggukensis]|uniref:ABC transporter permease n=1 Tax=Nocardioides donggukensis TaxID=2774019 RepID=A0A927K5Z9_9ACTN|nr:ABC transporter permease [Nocardioides donggukensis]MBD8869765.1 ABC transporter permease [Nocardioides donggukensis]